MQIHELNIFEGDLDSLAYAVVDNGNDTGKVNIPTLIKAATDAAAAVNARVDNIIAGDAPSAAEIIDARLGADGITYPSLGDAIRDQLTRVDNSVNLVPYPLSLTWTIGKLYEFSTGAELSSSSYCCALLQISAFPLIHVKTWAASPAGMVFFDSNMSYISGIPGTDALNATTYDIEIPQNAAYIGISCLTSKRDVIEVNAYMNEQISQLYKRGVSVPDYYAAIQTNLLQGIMHKNLTVYNPSSDYTGRYIAVHCSAGDEISITGFSVNTNYPAMVIAYDDTTSYSDFSSINTSYINRKFKLPKDGTVYVNGNQLVTPVVKRLTDLSEGSSAKSLLNSYLSKKSDLKAQLSNSGVLFVKKRISDTRSICVSFGNVGGNLLYGFSSIRYVDETSGEETSDSFDSNGTNINAASTDWFGPYLVQAVNNADGDVPEGNSYYTGGNHRTTNIGTGGGVTAVQESLSVLFGGETPLKDTTYITNEILVKWTNLVQGNNTSKADGTGRAVLRETWTMKIDSSGIHVENDICPLEDVIIKTYYGLQAYVPSSNIIYKGGSTRVPTPINTSITSGNKTCRSVSLDDGNFIIKMSMFDEDLGLFALAPYSFFNANGKAYSYLIGEDVSAHLNEHYYLKGEYNLWD